MSNQGHLKIICDKVPEIERGSGFIVGRRDRFTLFFGFARHRITGICGLKLPAATKPILRKTCNEVKADRGPGKINEGMDSQPKRANPNPAHRIFSSDSRL